MKDPRDRDPRDHAADLRAAAALGVDATIGVVRVVEGVHGAIGAFPIITDLAYAVVRGVTQVVGTSVDAALRALAPALGGSAPGPEREALLAALNGVVGDRLALSGSPLSIPTTLRLAPQEGRARTLLVLVHGSSMNDLQWTMNGHDHGLALARDLQGDVALGYLHYNSGRHVHHNGLELAALLEGVHARCDDVVLVGHSMGGLVARSAVHAAEAGGMAWRGKLRAFVGLGTPHHGAALERAGNLFETLLGVTPWTAPLTALGKVRSAGVTDLRHGNVVDVDLDRFANTGDRRTPTPLPIGVRCFAVAATKTPADVGAALDPRALADDNLVPVVSALGMHDDARYALRFDDARVVYGTNHLGLVWSPEVYALLRAWLA